MCTCIINIHVKISDLFLTFNFGISGASGIGTFPSQQQQFNMNQNIVSPLGNMPKMGLSSLASSLQTPLMSTPKMEQQSEMFNAESIFNLEQASGVSVKKTAETPIFKNIPSKSQVHHCTILNDLLKRPIEDNDCVVMQKFLSSFGNRQAFRTTTVKGPDSFFYCVGKSMHSEMPSDPAQIAAATHSGLTKYIADNKEFCEVS